MSPITPTTRPAKQTRKDSRYSIAERAIIGVYKTEYREQTTKEFRGQVMTEKILPAIFNYWTEQRGGQIIPEEESKKLITELAAYIRNNWRPLNTVLLRKAPVLRISPIELIWELHKPAVDEELMKLMGTTSITQFNQELFQNRVSACKKVLDALSIPDRAAFDLILETRKRQGNPPNVQRLRAEKHSDDIVRKWSAERWMDMGMSTVVFTIHTDSQGRLVADCQEDIAKRMGVNSQSFSDRYHAQVTEMKRLLLEYVKSMRTRQELNAGGGAGRADGVSDTVNDIDISLTNRGFPRLPKEVKGDLTKKQWEFLLRKYLSHHYSLATGHLSRHVPFEQLKKSTRLFVAPEHRPSNLKIEDPRNMRKDDIARLLRHVFERQEKEGIENAFRFKIYVGNEREFCTAVYPAGTIVANGSAGTGTGAAGVAAAGTGTGGVEEAGGARTGAASSGLLLIGSNATGPGVAETGAARTGVEVDGSEAAGRGAAITNTARTEAAGTGPADNEAGRGSENEAAGTEAAGTGGTGTEAAGREAAGREAAGNCPAVNVAAGTGVAGTRAAGNTGATGRGVASSRQTRSITAAAMEGRITRARTGQGGKR